MTQRIATFFTGAALGCLSTLALVANAGPAQVFKQESVQPQQSAGHVMHARVTAAREFDHAYCVCIDSIWCNTQLEGSVNTAVNNTVAFVVADTAQELARMKRLAEEGRWVEREIEMDTSSSTILIILKPTAVESMNTSK